MSVQQKLETVLSMVQTLNTYSCDDENEEAHIRNTALVKRHGKIPSYSLWYADCVGDEKKCLEWWKDFLKDLEPRKLDHESAQWFLIIIKSMVRHELYEIKLHADKLSEAMSDELEMLNSMSDEEDEVEGDEVEREGSYMLGLINRKI